MLKDLTIKKRMIMVAVGIFIASSVFMVFFTRCNQQQQLRETLTGEAKSGLALFPSQVTVDAEGLARALAGFTRLENLLRPFAEKNRKVLLANAKPVFDDIKARYNITHMYFIEPNGTVFLRAHKPEQFGDRLSRATYKKAAETHQLAVGIEMGKNFFSLRAVQPIFYKGTPIGYMELGEEIDHIFQRVKGITGNDMSLFLTQEFIKKGNVELTHERIGGFGLLDSTNKELATKLAEKVDMKKGLAEPTVVDVDWKGSRYIVGMGPLKDAFGDTAGILFLQKDVSKVYATIWKGIFINVAILSVILVLAGIAFYVSMSECMALFNKLSEAAKKVAGGELDVDVGSSRRDEVGFLAKGFQEMILGLRNMIVEIKAGGEQISASAGQIASTAEETARNNEAAAFVVEETAAAMQEINANIQNVSKSTQNQAASVTQTSASIEEMAVSIQRIAATTQQLVELSLQAKKAVNEGLGAVEKSMQGTDEISGAIMRSAETIAALGQRAEEIDKIVDVIDDIAEQTNLLALNAAIEAARAGEQGLGFAVVAEEVRKLAERSAKSTKEIATLIAGIQKESREAIKFMDKSTQTVEKGLKLNRQVGEALKNIEDSVVAVDRYAKEIGAATGEQSSGSAQIGKAVESLREITLEIMSAMEEQASGMKQIAVAMEKLEVMTQQNASGTVTLASSVEELTTQAERYKKIVGRFMLEGRGR